MTRTLYGGQKRYRTHRRLVTLDCCVATRLTSRCFRTVVTLLHDTQQARRCKPIAQPNLSNTLPFFGASLPLQQAAAQTPSCPAYATDCQSTPGYARSGRYASPSYFMLALFVQDRGPWERPRFADLTPSNGALTLQLHHVALRGLSEQRNDPRGRTLGTRRTSNPNAHGERGLPKHLIALA